MVLRHFPYTSVSTSVCPTVGRPSNLQDRLTSCLLPCSRSMQSSKIFFTSWKTQSMLYNILPTRGYVQQELLGEYLCTFKPYCNSFSFSSTIQIYKMTQKNNYKKKKQKSPTRRAFICKTLFNTLNSVTWSKCRRCIGKGAGTKYIKKK